MSTGKTADLSPHHVTTPPSHGRLGALRRHDPQAADVAERVVELAGLTVPRTVLDDSRVCFTLRQNTAGGPTCPEGMSGRYGAILGLGASRLGHAEQAAALRGNSAADLVARAVADVRVPGGSADLGDLAMATWASAEVAGVDGAPLARLVLPALLEDSRPTTVTSAWALTALVAAGRRRDADKVAGLLLEAAGPAGLWPHWLHAERAPGWRRHVSCFADQVYPVQALSRYAAAYGHAGALAAAQRCADALCRLQGPEGQWWWHYDSRAARVVEGYPVYAVHQAGMAPMALMELEEAGGVGHPEAVALGLRWLAHPTEASGPLVDDEESLVWRKVGRREPVRRGVRAVRTVTTALHAGVRLEVLDRACPPGPVDHESRPYEAGWALYAWMDRGGS